MIKEAEGRKRDDVGAHPRCLTGEKLTVRVAVDLWRRKTGLWQEDAAPGRGINHMTGVLAQTAAGSYRSCS